MQTDEADGYHLLQELSPQRTFLCTDASANVVVLKRLGDDCLHRNQLHPSIKDRLAHVRELAHPRIATLRTVERWEGNAHLVWTFLDGETWDDIIPTSNDHAKELISALAATVNALHETGIVHGSLHGRNVIVRAKNQVWLTHVSPYLYADPQVDIQATVELICEKMAAELSTRLEPLINKLKSGELSLHEFSHLILDVNENPLPIESTLPEKQRGYRISSLLMATVFTAIAIITWISVQKLESKPSTVGATTFPSLRH